MATDFTLDGYRALLEAFFTRGYEARGFDDVDLGSKHLIVRHDLDMTIRAAVPVGELEHKMGVRATYFVLVRSELYNPFSAAGGRDLRRLVDWGHTIGLHFNALLYPVDRASLDRGAASECAVLETIIGQPVKLVSLHRPGKSAQGKLICSAPGPLGGRRHADELIYFHDIAYRSDSRGGWHYGHPLDHPAVPEGRALELLTHPIWWTNSAEDPSAKLSEFLEGRFQLLDQELAANCLAHKPGRYRK